MYYMHDYPEGGRRRSKKRGTRGGERRGVKVAMYRVHARSIDIHM
jgi:hypothetical protein